MTHLYDLVRCPRSSARGGENVYLLLSSRMGHSHPLLVYFGLFKQSIQLLQQINVKNCPSSIWCWDSNLQPSEYESPPITTRPGLPLQLTFLQLSDGEYHLVVWRGK